MGTISSDNILRLYRSATPAERAEGETWYSSALTHAVGMSDRYGVTVHQAVAVIAVLSPQVPWDRNLVAADELLRTGDCSGVLGLSKAKALRILSGEDVGTVMACPACVSAMGAHVCSGEKVRSFYAAIMAAGETDTVCVDRHAYDAAIGERGDDRTRHALDRKGVYGAVADAYRSAASTLGVSAAVVQAVVWVAWRNTLKTTHGA